MADIMTGPHNTEDVIRLSLALNISYDRSKIEMMDIFEHITTEIEKSIDQLHGENWQITTSSVVNTEEILNQIDQLKHWIQEH
jgi:hypothetical protein